MSLFSALSVGRSGLQTSQNALNTTAHNVSNADTKGYTRQQVLLGSNVYNTIKYSYQSVSNQQIGLGVVYTQTRQVRDDFLDKLYRKESGRSAFYEVSNDTLYQIENIMGEPGENPFQNAVDRLWESIQELAKKPNDAVNEGLLVQRANQFVKEANLVRNELNAYQDSLNEQVSDTVQKINTYGKAIYDLNKEILKIEGGNIEHANDLRDQRNYCLDQLGSLCNMTYSVDVFGNYKVQIEGESFVTRDYVNEIGLYKKEDNGFYIPYWPQFAPKTVDANGRETVDITHAEVVDTGRKISSELNTDIGRLESLMYARGDHRADYTELDPEQYDGISSSLIMNVQAEFDQLIHDITAGINDILAEASDSASGYLCNEDGSPIQLFTKAASDNYIFNEAAGKWEKMKENPNRKETLFTGGNIRVNDMLLKQPTLLGFVKSEGSVDFETAEKLCALFDEETHTLNPNVKTKGNFSDYYMNLTNQIADSGSVYKKLASDQEGTVSAACAAREQVIGVSTDEELTNMIKFQNAYNASSRYINAVDELLEHLINAMA